MDARKRGIEKVLAAPSLPSLPAVAIEVLELTQNPEVPIPAIAKLVQNDQALAGRILKTVNSSFYGLSKPCPTISRAMAYLGLNTVKSLVLGFSLAEAFMDGVEENPFGFCLVDLWRGALFSAASSRTFAARHMRTVDPDEVFTAALLQDIGILAAATALGDQYTMVVGEVSIADETVQEREQEILQFDHMEVGAALARRWKLPEEIIATIEHHHDRDSEELDEHPFADTIRCVQFGRLGAAILLAHPDDVPKLRGKIVDRSSRWFELEKDDATEWIDEINTAAEQMSRLFKLPEAGEARPVSDLMHEASERLLEHQMQMDQKEELLVREQDRLMHEALTDGLTGVANRKKFDMFLQETFATALKEDGSMGVILLDADKFKNLNDTLGHQAGDAVLVELAKRVSAVVKDKGLAARYGGEEFAVVLPGMTAGEAGTVAEQIRRAVGASAFDITNVPCKANSVEVTVSCGVSAREPGTSDVLKSAATLLRASDKAVYAAKNAGRNRVKILRLRGEDARKPKPAPKPAAASEDESGGNAASAPAEAKPEKPGRRILVVEDDLLQQKLITLPLEKSGGYTVVTAASAHEALAKLGIDRDGKGTPDETFDMIICDLGLPDFGGVELVGVIRSSKFYSIIPVVILSASDRSADVGASLNAGANAFINKEALADDPKGRILELAEFWARMVPSAAA